MNDCQDTCTTTVVVVLTTVSIQKALNVLPVSDKYDCVPVSVPGGRGGHFLDMPNEDVPLDGVTF